jgi:Fe-S-cluster containining protein
VCPGGHDVPTLAPSARYDWPWMGDDPNTPDDCRTCGACCFSESPRHARVTGDDYARLGDDAEALVTWIGNVAFMRLQGHAADLPPTQRCIALALDPSEGAFSCSIYDRRPQVCRDLERGGSACVAERHAKGERPHRALVDARFLVTPRP